MGLSGRRAALVALVATDLAWLGGQHVLEGAARWVPVAVVLALHAALVAAERRRPRLGAGEVLAAVAVVAVAAAAVPPYGSRDLYQYAAYGRLRAHHGINPYLAGPAAAAGDPIVARTAPAWRDTPTVYGPLFTAVSALGAHAFGTSVLLARLWFQGLAALALVGSTRLLRGRGAPPWALLAIGLSPPLVAVVNGGHNDLVAGALGLAGADLVRRARVGRGAIVLAGACLVKLLVAPIVVGVVVGLVAARRRREAGLVVGVVAGLLAAGYAAVGGVAALAPLGALGDGRSRASPWGLVERVVPGAASWPLGLLATLAAASAGAVLVRRVLTWRSRPGPDAAAGVELGVGLGVVACALAAYVLPWYPAAFLPLAGLVPRGRAAVALHVTGAALLVAYVQPPGRPASALVGAGAAATVCGVVLAVATAVLLRRPRPEPPLTDATEK